MGRRYTRRARPNVLKSERFACPVFPPHPGSHAVGLHLPPQTDRIFSRYISDDHTFGIFREIIPSKRSFAQGSALARALSLARTDDTARLRRTLCSSAAPVGVKQTI